MIWLLLILTHVACVWLGRIVTLRAARHWPDPPHLEDVVPLGDHIPHRSAPQTLREEETRQNHRDSKVVIILIMASLFVIALGAQAWMERRDQRADDAREDRQVACFEAWGKGMVDTIQARTGDDPRAEANGADEVIGTVQLEKATQRRDRALDQIILTVIAFREIPPQADDEDFDRVLREYAAAIRNLDRVVSDVDVTRASNPYPELHC